MTAIEQAVERVIDDMHDRLGEPLTIDQMARTAMFSKFHFTRVFRELTGLSPARFLSALRLQEAKRLLVTTQLSVADISNRVGYSSVGTFSSRFKACVGLAPSTYRQLGGFAEKISTADRHLSASRPAVIRGEVIAPSPEVAGTVFVGLFPQSVPQGRPVRCTVLDRPGTYCLEDVPPGSWYVLVHSVRHGMEEEIDVIEEDPMLCVGTHGPVTVGTGATVEAADITLRPMRALDPPVLLALLDMRMNALDVVAAS